MVNEGERWIDAEIDFLKDHFPDLHHCSQRLGRSIAGIRKQARKLGLIKPQPKIYNPYRPGPRRIWRERAMESL